MKPLPVSTSGRILPRTADLVFDSLLCMFDSFLCLCAVRFMFCPVRLILVQLDLFLCVSLYLYAVQFILWGSIHLCTVQFIFVPVRFNFCAVRFSFWAVRFIFAWFDSFFAVLIFCDRFSFYLCAFHIVHFGLEDFVRNGAPYYNEVIKISFPNGNSGIFLTELIWLKRRRIKKGGN